MEGRKSRGNTSTEADSLFSQSLDEDGTVSNRTVRNTERYSQIVSGWNKVLDALDFSERVRNGRSLDPQFQDDILTFKFVMKILVPLLGDISKWKTEDSLRNIPLILWHMFLSMLFWNLKRLA